SGCGRAPPSAWAAAACRWIDAGLRTPAPAPRAPARVPATGSATCDARPESDKPVDIPIIDDIYHLIGVDMRYSAQQKQETRERIVRAASQHFRGRGWDGVAIADLMSKLALTHGGFYRHFESKEQLFAEAIGKGFEEITAKFKGAVEKASPGGELTIIIEQYLSPEHCANPQSGCPMAALASEIARYPRAVRAKIDRAMRDHVKR